MSTEITIKRVEGKSGGYWLASDGARSPDGFRWFNKHHLDIIGTPSPADYRMAYINHIDSLAEQEAPEPVRAASLALYQAGFWSCDRECDAHKLWEDLRDALGLPPGGSPKSVRAKVGDWIEVTRDTPDGSAAVTGIKYQVIERIGTSGVRLNIDRPNCVSDNHYTIVDPPKPETFTGDARGWGTGVYVGLSMGGGWIVVCVSYDGSNFGYHSSGAAYQTGFDFGISFTRLSTNPADFPKILAEQGEGSV